ncbi:hypothetical protein RJ641_006156 [Dillenia turbinata]|uniref:Uncharacterized protein n=1 Tax=Dillenia turbinata TaxID=194707 RepID=A0AAN8V4W0_9MAGN
MFHLEGGGRRFMLMATLPVLFSMNESLTEGFGVKAADLKWIGFQLKFCVEGIVIVGYQGTFTRSRRAVRSFVQRKGCRCTSVVGMNGSIIYELERPENADSNILEISEITCHVTPFPLIVSWADMIDVGGAEAVAVCGGGPDPEGKLPPESLDASGLKQCFQKKGFLIWQSYVFDNSYFKILLEKPWMSGGGSPSMLMIRICSSMTLKMHNSNQSIPVQDGNIHG